jgi:hypothetical protein
MTLVEAQYLPLASPVCQTDSNHYPVEAESSDMVQFLIQNVLSA